MPESRDHPGVYFEETPSGVRKVESLPTSRALFIGCATQGPAFRPVVCSSINAFEQVFSSDTAVGELPLQIKLFFLNGGSQCEVIRVEADRASDAEVDSIASPLLSDYERAFELAEQKIDNFNLMILAQDAVPAQPISALYGPASIVCRNKHALLLMDAPSAWQDSQTAVQNVDQLRVGLVNDHAALFYPNVSVQEGGQHRHIGPAGAMAGIMARIDARRGVWKAPAGAQAELRGIVGLEYEFHDREIGDMNARAINIVRRLPAGVVNWGARTMAGGMGVHSEYKYIPVRRLASFLQQSLEKSLRWTVFEPNDEPLWAQIRLSVGEFMQSLFRQGAFQGSHAGKAYFVKCDRDTTTQSDRERGVANLQIGFAALKPAEFVVITISLQAGQI